MDEAKDRSDAEFSCEKFVHGKTFEGWADSHPLIPKMVKGEPVLWVNPGMAAFAQALADIDLNREDIADAEDRLQRFAPYLRNAFPEVRDAGGIIESEVREVPKLAIEIADRYNVEVPRRLLMKLDSHLPISGSVKARGGIYEVLCHGEKLAKEAGFLSEDENYERLADPAVKRLFSQHGVVVGSTGNLGLSIGIAASTLGFSTTVHMSDDARAWKKARLRSHGVNVVEHTGDYGVAVENGRKESERDPASYFVDDENSRTLFLGYAVGGWRLKKQLDAMGVAVTAESPLVVYLPCGVGGGPGGISFGLKQAFGDNVHCVFAEPTQSPCMLLGMYTGLHDKVAIGDFGIRNQTAADGLAVGRPSGFVGRAMHRMISAVYSLTDDEMFALVYMAQSSEGINLEPSAVAGAPGFARLVAQREAQPQRLGISPSAWKNATQLIWATGGGMVPMGEHQTYLAEGARVHAAKKKY